MDTVEKAWLGFKSAVLSTRNKPSDLVEMEMAFYAGHAALLEMLSRVPSLRHVPADVEALLYDVSVAVLKYNARQLARAERDMTAISGRRTDN